MLPYLVNNYFKKKVRIRNLRYVIILFRKWIKLIPRIFESGVVVKLQSDNNKQLSKIDHCRSISNKIH